MTRLPDTYETITDHERRILELETRKRGGGGGDHPVHHLGGGTGPPPTTPAAIDAGELGISHATTGDKTTILTYRSGPHHTAQLLIAQNGAKTWIRGTNAAGSAWGAAHELATVHGADARYAPKGGSYSNDFGAKNLTAHGIIVSTGTTNTANYPPNLYMASNGRIYKGTKIDGRYAAHAHTHAYAAIGGSYSHDFGTKKLTAHGTVSGTALNMTGSVGHLSHNGHAVIYATRPSGHLGLYTADFSMMYNHFYPNSTGHQFLGVSTHRWSTIYSSHALNTSDPTLKKKIRRIPTGTLDKIRTVHPITFKWKVAEDPYHPELHEHLHQADHHGIDAAELAAAFPDIALAVRPTTDGPLYIDPLAATATLWQAVRELADQTEARLDALEGATP